MKLNRKLNDVRARAHHLNIKDEIFYYTPEQDAIIRKYYISDFKKCCELIPHKTAKQIKTHALKLGIIKTVKWTVEEEQILKDNYFKIGAIGCKALLKNKELNVIQTKAARMGLKYSYNKNNWTKEDDEYLIKNYPTKGSECIKELLKTGKYKRNSISTRIQTLGLKKITKYKSSKKVMCVETEIIYASARDAAEQLNINLGSLQNACKSGRIVSGYHWRYVED